MKKIMILFIFVLMVSSVYAIVEMDHVGGGGTAGSSSGGGGAAAAVSSCDDDATNPPDCDRYSYRDPPSNALSEAAVGPEDSGRISWAAGEWVCTGGENAYCTKRTVPDQSPNPNPVGGNTQAATYTIQRQDNDNSVEAVKTTGTQSETFTYQSAVHDVQLGDDSSSQLEILSYTNKKGKAEHFAQIEGQYVEVYQDGGTWRVCTDAQDGNECDSQNDGLTSTILNRVPFNALPVTTPEQEEQEEAPANPGDPVAESQRIYSTGWGGRCVDSGGNADVTSDKSFCGTNWDAAIAESLQLAGSTQWLSDLVIGEDHRIQTRERYDRFMSNVFNTEYFSSLICSGQLPEVLPGQGLGQIIDSQGNPMTVAHITGQKHGPQIFMCDLESEEQCPMVGDVQSECVDMVCEIDDELVEGYLYVIEWSVRAPSPLVLESCQHSIGGCNDGLGIQIKLDMGEDTEKNLYEDAYGSEYPLVLLPGAQESDRIITTSLVDYSTITIDFHDPIMSAMGASTTRFMAKNLGTDEDQGNRLSRVYNTITEISSPTTFTYGPELELPPSTLSSSTSTVEQVNI